MSYIDSNLMTDEQVVYKARLHWVIFGRAIFLVLLAIAIAGAGAFAVDSLQLADEVLLACLAVAGILLLMGLITGARVFLLYISSEFGVTTKRVIIKVGFVRRRTTELLLRQVEAISVDQSVGGRMLGFGTLTLTGTGGVREVFHDISSPLEFRRQIQHQAE